MHLCEPVALLQPWQHCPPQTLTPGSGGSGCFWRGGAPLLLPWGPGGGLGRGPKRAGLEKEAAELE